MTNGEKIKAILKPRTDQIRIYSDWVEIEIQSLSINFSCELSWWNAEYKEPTTKNDLGVDCISRADAIKAMQDKAKRLKNEDTINGLCGAVAILFELPSVTPQLSVPEVTALAEWTEKLTKASEDAYNKGYADGMKEQEPITSKHKKR